jgi:glycosyltransferase involved in cell wall biosynthesis
MSVRRDQRLRIFLVGTEFFRSYGGIQYINRLLVRALREMGRATPLDLEVFSFTDGPEHFPAGEQGQCVVRWHGASRRRGKIAWQLTKRLANARPDLVIFTHVSLLPLEVLVRAMAPGARVAALAHGTEAWRRLEGIAARVLPRVDAFVSPSAFTAQKLVEVQGIHADRVTVIPHGLDPEWAEECCAGHACEEGRTARSGRLLLSVTRLSRADREGKGIELVLQALPAVVKRCPGVRYMVVGGGGDLPRMAEMVRQLGLDGRTEITGARRDDALRRAYADADVFVLPTQVEGFGVVFLEAMFCGLPVVAVRASATPEVVEDGVTGVLVAPTDLEGLSAALIGLLSDGDRRRAMGEAGRRRVDRLYRFEHFAARWERWLAVQVPEAVYAARQSSAFTLARAAAGAR